MSSLCHIYCTICTPSVSIFSLPLHTTSTIFQNRSRQPLFLAHAKEKATNYTPKTVPKTRGAGFASQKSVLFLFFIRYAAPGTNRWFPNRPVCILWCSFSMLKAILTRYHSTITLALPLVRKRRKFMSSLTMANTPSAWMERLIRSRIPSSVEIFFSIASRCWMKYLETFSRFLRSSSGVLSVFF